LSDEFVDGSREVQEQVSENGEELKLEARPQPNIAGLKAVEGKSHIYQVHKLHFVPDSHTHTAINDTSFVEKNDKPMLALDCLIGLLTFVQNISKSGFKKENMAIMAITNESFANFLVRLGFLENIKSIDRNIKTFDAFNDGKTVYITIDKLITIKDRLESVALGLIDKQI
jgi:hypothetical protein